MILSQEEQDTFIAAITKDPELVFHVGITPANFHELVQHNSSIAHKVLICIYFSKQIMAYFDALSAMQMTIHSLEIFSQLANEVELPKEYMQIFLKTCIRQCNSSQETQLNKNRMVRLLSVFLYQLVKIKHINVEEMYGDIQHFCLEFLALKEVNALYKALQVEKIQGGGKA